MLRFGELLLSKTSESNSFQIEEFFAKDVFGKLCKSRKFFKWAAYLDKYILFPKKLSSFLSKNQKRFGLVHVIDHSNSVYFSKIKNAPHIKKLVTCHDLIAIRTALNEFSEAPRTSASGKYLQRLIYNALSHADCYACDSSHSLKDLNRLVPSSKDHSEIIHLGTQCSFTLENSKNTNNDLPFDLGTQPFLLHVGNSAWYKNRKAVFGKHDLTKAYSLTDACNLVKDISTTKFDASVGDPPSLFSDAAASTFPSLSSNSFS